MFNLKRLILNHLGVTRKDDTLPQRLLKTPLGEGGAKGYLPDFDAMMDEYYQARGWDQNGIPTVEKIELLDIDRKRLGL